MSHSVESAPTISINPETARFVQETMFRLELILPHSAEYGGIDFRGSAEAVVVNTLVEHDREYLAMLRTGANDSHGGEWNNIAGYMQSNPDGSFAILDTLTEELESEAGIEINKAESVTVGSVIEVSLPTRRLYVVPAIIHFAMRPDVALNWEHSGYAWLSREQFLDRPRVPVVDRVFDEMLGPDLSTAGTSAES